MKEASPRFQSRVNKFVRQEYQKLIKAYVQPITNLPVGADIDIEVKPDYFRASGAIGSPTFGWIGLVMKGIVITFLGVPIGVTVDEYKAFLYGYLVKEDKLLISNEAGAVYSTDIRAAALLANKIRNLDEIFVEVGDKEKIAENINGFIVKTLAG